MSARYSRLAVPVQQPEANDRMRNFFEALGELREKHQIPDVHIIVRQNIATDSGEAPGFCTAHYGDQAHAMQMCSFAVGHATGEHQKFVLQARAHGMKLGAEVALKEVERVTGHHFGD